MLHLDLSFMPVQTSSLGQQQKAQTPAETQGDELQVPTIKHCPGTFSHKKPSETRVSAPLKPPGNTDNPPL